MAVPDPAISLATVLVKMAGSSPAMTVLGVLRDALLIRVTVCPETMR
jgi:hypothetical protein